MYDRYDELVLMDFPQLKEKWVRIRISEATRLTLDLGALAVLQRCPQPPLWPEALVHIQYLARGAPLQPEAQRE